MYILTNTETFLCITVTQNDHPSPVLEIQDAPNVQEIKSTSMFTHVLPLLTILMAIFRASS